MKRLIVDLLSVALIVTSVFGGEDATDIVHSQNEPGYSRRAYDTGRHDATRDIREDHLVIEISGGPPAPWDSDWARLLRERFGIELREVAGCVVDYQISGHERGYNEISFAEIRRRFGKDVVRETRVEVQKEWYASHPK